MMLNKGCEYGGVPFFKMAVLFVWEEEWEQRDVNLDNNSLGRLDSSST